LYLLSPVAVLDDLEPALEEADGLVGTAALGMQESHVEPGLPVGRAALQRNRILRLRLRPLIAAQEQLAKPRVCLDVAGVRFPQQPPGCGSNAEHQQRGDDYAARRPRRNGRTSPRIP